MNNISDSAIVLGDAETSIDQITKIADGALVSADTKSLHNMDRTHRYICEAIQQGKVIYGLTTGVGSLVSTRLDAAQAANSQINMLRSHACGTGPDLTIRETRAIMAVTLKSLLQGYSGVSSSLALRLIQMLNRQVIPWAPSGGSVGYLIATAHIGLAVFGEGQCWYNGELLPSSQALSLAGIDPMSPGPREGHALIGGTYEITGLGCLAISDFERLVPVADMAGGICLEALRGNTRGYDARLHKLRLHPGQQETARVMRALLRESEILEAWKDYRVQDALSLRCIPQIHGAVRDQLENCALILTRELNSVTDNPLFVIEDNQLVTLPGGNGHGAPVALALDALAIAIAQLSTASQARSDRITNSHLSELPAFLVPTGSGCSGMMIPPYVATALAGDNRSLAVPASIHTVPTCAGQEDHISMGVSAARKALKAVENAENIIGIELLCGCQAIEFHRPLRGSIGTEATLAMVRKTVPFRQQDTILYPDIHAAREIIRQGDLTKLLKQISSSD